MTCDSKINLFTVILFPYFKGTYYPHVTPVQFMRAQGIYMYPI